MVYKRMKHIIISSCSRIPFLYQYGITLFACSALLLFWYLFINPFVHAILLTQEHTRQALQDTYLTMQHAVQELDRLDNQVTHSLYTLEQIKQMSYDDVIFSIMNAAQKHSLVFLRYAYDKKIKKEWYTKKQISFQVRGALDSVTHFLQYMDEVPELLSCNSLVVTQHEKEYELSCVMRYAQIKPLQLKKAS